MTAFKVPVSAGAKRENQFEFQLPGASKVYRIPFIHYLHGKSFKQIGTIESSDSELEQVSAIYDLIGDLSGAPVEDLDAEQIGTLFAAWRDASSVEPGEADGSVD